MALIGLSLLFASFIVVCLRPPAWLPGFLAGLRQKTLGGPTIRPLIKPDEPQDDKERTEKDKPHKQEKEQQQPPASSVEDQARRNKDDNDDKVAMAPPPIIIATDPVQDTAAEEESQAEDQQLTPRAVPTIFQVDGESSSDSDVVPILITPDPPSPPTIVEAVQLPSNISSMPSPPQLNVIPEIPVTIATTSSTPEIRNMPPPPIPSNKRPSKPSVAPQPSSSSSATTSSLSTSSLPRRVPTLNNSVSPAPTRERNLPIPRRGAPPPKSSSSLGGNLLPPPTATSIPKKPSRAVTLEPGHSPLDWARLAQSPTSDLRNLPPNTPYLRVTPSMLREQNGRKGRDAWTAYGGKVYNVSPYVPFHPGGKGELLRGAGKDGTRLFAEVHPWVNYETMLQSCLIGLLVEEHETVNEMEEMD